MLLLLCSLLLLGEHALRCVLGYCSVSLTWPGHGCVLRGQGQVGDQAGTASAIIM
jgi:hypothetical protein